MLVFLDSLSVARDDLRRGPDEARGYDAAAGERGERGGDDAPATAQDEHDEKAVSRRQRLAMDVHVLTQ